MTRYRHGLSPGEVTVARIAVFMLFVISGAFAGAVWLAPIVREPRDSVAASQSVGAGIGGFIGLSLAVGLLLIWRLRLQFQLRSLFVWLTLIAVSLALEPAKRLALGMIAVLWVVALLWTAWLSKLAYGVSVQDGEIADTEKQ